LFDQGSYELPIEVFVTLYRTSHEHISYTTQINSYGKLISWRRGLAVKAPV